MRYMADITPTEKAMLTDRNWPFFSLLVFTCAAAEQPKSYKTEKKGRMMISLPTKRGSEVTKLKAKKKSKLNYNENIC